MRYCLQGQGCLSFTGLGGAVQFGLGVAIWTLRVCQSWSVPELCLLAKILARVALRAEPRL